MTFEEVRDKLVVDTYNTIRAVSGSHVNQTEYQDRLAPDAIRILNEVKSGANKQEKKVEYLKISFELANPVFDKVKWDSEMTPVLDFAFDNA